MAKLRKTLKRGDKVGVYGRETHGDFIGVGNFGIIVGLRKYTLLAFNDEFYDVDMGFGNDYLTFHSKQMRRLVKKGSK